MQDNQKKLEEIVRAFAENQSGVHLDESQKKFLSLVKEQGICVQVTKKGKKDKDFQELTNLLSDMHKNGIIPSFQIVEV